MAPSTMELTGWSRFTMTLSLLQLPFVLLVTVLKLSLGLKKSPKTRARVLFDTSARFILENVDAAQLQALSVPTLDSYKKWAKEAKQDPVVDELGSDARLFWVGSKAAKRMILYCHGGGFVGPLSDFQVAFWHRIQQSLAEETKEEPLTIAVLQYSLAPAKFPTQVNQLALAVQHVLSLGVKTSDIYLAGDSAGANLALQYIICMLHPIPSISQTIPLTPFAGACLVSPWVVMSNTSFKSHTENAKRDLTPPEALEAWAMLYLSGLSDEQKPYVDQSAAPADWLAGIDRVVRRVIITSGHDEVLRDAIAHFAEILERHHSDVTTAVLDGEVHADPLFDFAAKPKDLTAGGKKILEWFRVGLQP